MNPRSLIVVTASCLACGTGEGIPPGEGLSTADLDSSPAPTHLVVVSTDYASGVVSTIDLTTLVPSSLPVFTLPGTPAHVSGDTIARVAGRTLFLLDRAPEDDDVTAFDLRTTPPSLLGQYTLLTATEAGDHPGARPPANAHDLMVVPGSRAYVARYELNALGVMSLTSGAITSTIDLSAYVGSAAYAYPDAFAQVGDEVWVTLERLDNLCDPTQQGLVARIDPMTNTVVGSITLPVPNPVGAMLVAPDGDGVVVAAPGSYQRMGDGGVVQITASGTASLLVTESDVGGNVDAVAVLDAHTVLLRVTGIEVASAPGACAGTPSFATRLVAYDLTTRSSTQWLTWSIYNPAIPVVVGGRVYVGDPGDVSHAGAGVRVYTLDGTQVTTQPIPVLSGMFPYDLRPAP